MRAGVVSTLQAFRSTLTATTDQTAPSVTDQRAGPEDLAALRENKALCPLMPVASVALGAGREGVGLGHSVGALDVPVALAHVGQVFTDDHPSIPHENDTDEMPDESIPTDGPPLASAPAATAISSAVLNRSGSQ